MNVNPYCLQLRTGRYKSLACVVAFVFLKVLDKSSCQILCLLFPLGSVRIGISRIKDSGINARKLCRNLEIEDRDLLRRSLAYITV